MCHIRRQCAMDDSGHRLATSRFRTVKMFDLLRCWNLTCNFKPPKSGWTSQSCDARVKGRGIGKSLFRSYTQQSILPGNQPPFTNFWLFLCVPLWHIHNGNNIRNNAVVILRARSDHVDKVNYLWEGLLWQLSTHQYWFVIYLIAGGHSIRYSIYSGDPDGLFHIDTITGSIQTARELDHENRASVLLNVQATSGDPPVYGHTQVC